MHKKVYLTAGLLLIVISLLLYMLHAVNGSIAMLKCLTLAYGVMLLSRGCMEKETMHGCMVQVCS